MIFLTKFPISDLTDPIQSDLIWFGLLQITEVFSASLDLARFES